VWQTCDTDPATGLPVNCQPQRENYAEWEREYGTGGSLLAGQPPFDGPPFPSPTPYAIVGTSYALGQRVEVAPLHVRATVEAGPLVGTRQLYVIRLGWHNPTSAPLPVDYARQVLLRTITVADGALQTGDGWGASEEALRAIDRPGLPTSIPPGESEAIVPVLGPPGRPKTVELRFDTRPAAIIPTPGVDLVGGDLRQITVQWTDTQIIVGPPCQDSGALTPWEGSGWGQAAPVELPPPPGADRLVQLVVAQVGKPYVWGAAGPNAFDCSGLAVWSYAQIGIRGLPRTSYSQFPAFPPVTPGAALPGDLIYFDIESTGRIDHVGVFAGDLDGDGKMDMVHAASPALGVRAVYNVFGSQYYAPRIRGLRTLRGWKT
jgi:cell wall-associated NlpC family hydrolase